MSIQTAKTAITKLLKPTYFDSIPLGEIKIALADHGLALLQEDYTPWEGFFCGEAGRCSFIMGLAGSLKVVPHYFNLTWYTMPSGKLEVIGYIS